MEERKFDELLNLYFANEISDSDKKQLEKFIEQSEKAKSKFLKMQKFHKVIMDDKIKISMNQLLMESRNDLMRNIKRENFKTSFSDKINNWIDDLQLSFARLVTAGSFLVIIGIFLGYFIFNTGLRDRLDSGSGEILDVDKVISSGADLNNIRLVDLKSDYGEIKISFEASRPFEYTGSFEDPFTQQLLADLLIKSDNAGNRLRAISAISEKISEKYIPDRTVINAMINSMKNDDNPGVRRTALEALRKYPLDEKVKNAILFVLGNDENAGMRIAAINFLADMKMEGLNFDSSVIKELAKKTETEENLFIKNLAETMLKGEKL